MGGLNRLNQLSGGVRILSALRNPAIIFSVFAAVGCMESPTKSASPAENEVTATAAQVLDDTIPAFLQAEAATTIAGGAEVGANVSGYTGSGYVGYPHAAGGVVEWQRHIQFDLKRKTIMFRYSNGSSATAFADVRVNGTLYASLPFPRTGSWSTWSTVSIVRPVAATITSVSVTVTSTKGMDLDYVVLE